MRSADAQLAAPTAAGGDRKLQSAALAPLIVFAALSAVLAIGLRSHGLCEGDEMLALDRVRAAQGYAVVDVQRAPWLPTALSALSSRALTFLPLEISLRLPSLLAVAILGTIAFVLARDASPSLFRSLSSSPRPAAEAPARERQGDGIMTSIAALLVAVSSLGTFLDARSMAGPVLGELFVTLAICLGLWPSTAPSPQQAAATTGLRHEADTQAHGLVTPSGLRTDRRAWPYRIAAMACLVAASASVGIVMGGVLPLVILAVATPIRQRSAYELSSGVSARSGTPAARALSDAISWNRIWAAGAAVLAVLGAWLSVTQAEGYIPLLGAAKDLELLRPQSTLPWPSIVDSVLFRTQPWFPLVVLGLALPGSRLARIWVGASLAMGAMWSSVYGVTALPIAVPCALATVHALRFMARALWDDADSVVAASSANHRGDTVAPRSTDDAMQSPASRGRALVLVAVAGMLLLRKAISASTVIAVPGMTHAGAATTSLGGAARVPGQGVTGPVRGVDLGPATLEAWQHVLARPLEGLALLLIAGFVLAQLRRVVRGGHRLAPRDGMVGSITAVAALAVLCWQIVVLGPAVEQLGSARALVAKLGTLADPSSNAVTSVAVLGQPTPSLRHYLRRTDDHGGPQLEPLTELDSLEQLAGHWAREGAVGEQLALVPRHDLPRLHRERRAAGDGFAVIALGQMDYALVSNTDHDAAEDLDPARGVRLKGPCPLKHKASTNFADTVELVGWEFETSPRRGRPATLSLCLRVLKPPPSNLRIVVHLEHGKRSRSIDRPTVPTLGAYPSSAWREPDLVLHQHRVELSPLELGAGPHDLVLGLSRGEEQLLPIVVAEAEAHQTEERIKPKSTQWVILESVDVR